MNKAKFDSEKIENLSVAFLEALKEFSKKETCSYLEVISAIDYFRAFLVKRAEQDMRKTQESN